MDVSTVEESSAVFQRENIVQKKMDPTGGGTTGRRIGCKAVYESQNILCTIGRAGHCRKLTFIFQFSKECDYMLSDIK